MTAIKKANIIVYGMVQGVFYRDSTMRKARELGLAGTVRNLPDGTVAIEAQGPVSALEDLIKWAGEGPPAAVVKDLDVTYGDPDPDLSGFQVRF